MIELVISSNVFCRLAQVAAYELIACRLGKGHAEGGLLWGVVVMNIVAYFLEAPVHDA